MIRKSLFWGFTFILVVVLILLIVRSSRLENQADKSEEPIQESKPSLTRVLAPQLLELAQPKLRLELEQESDGKNQSQTAWHEFEILNKGREPYSSILLTIDYMDRSGKVLATKTYLNKKNIMPGAILKLAGIKFMGLPVSTASCRVEITYADLGPAPKSD
jgi:hypothetical protein